MANGQAVWITVKFVNGPKNAGGKHGSIRTVEYDYISVPVEWLTEFRKGGKYLIEMETTDKGYKNFIRFASQQPQQPQARPVGGYAQASAPPARRIPPQPQPAAHRRPAIPPTQPRLPQQPVFNDSESRNIYITGIVGRAMSSGKFGSFEIKELTQAAANAWDEVMLGKPPVESIDPAFDDAPPDVNDYAPQGGQQYTSIDDDEIPFG